MLVALLLLALGQLGLAADASTARERDDYAVVSRTVSALHHPCVLASGLLRVLGIGIE